MISNKRMKFVKSENGINFYLFKPSIFSLYYNDRNFKHKVEPPHRYTISHKLHMLWYLLLTRRGYRILYFERDGEILSYIVYVHVNNSIIKKCEKNAFYTVFLWTYPEHRGQGLATLMSHTMLNDLHLDYTRFYKVINKDNISSIRVAEKSGFKFECETVKSRYLHTINRVDKGDQYLYCKLKDK